MRKKPDAPPEYPELARKYRPTAFTDIVGQEAAAVALERMAKNPKKVPHAIMMVGPSGTGKTTASRILKGILGVADRDYKEVNAADKRGIDDMRDIRRLADLAGMNGGRRLFVLDECHMLTRESMTSLLKVLEDPPDHSYFVLPTTDPNKLLPTIRTRCKLVQFSAVPAKDLRELVRRVAKAEGKRVYPSVLSKIADGANGSARQALNLLQDAIDCETEADQTAAVVPPGVEKGAIDLCRLICRKSPVPQWKEVLEVLREVKGEDPESLRRAVLGYATAMVLSGEWADELVFGLMHPFEMNFFDSGFASLVVACRKSVMSRQQARAGGFRR